MPASLLRRCCCAAVGAAAAARAATSHADCGDGRRRFRAQYLNDLSDENWAAIDRLRPRVRDVMRRWRDRSSFGEDDVLARFLISQNWRLDRAEQALRDALHWREAVDAPGLLENPGERLPAPVLGDPRGISAVWPAALHGRDRDGKVIHWVRFERDGAREAVRLYGHEAARLWAVYCLERTRLYARLRDSDRVTYVVDAANLGLWILAEPVMLNMLKQTVSMLQKSYPETAHHVLVLSPSAAFRLLWQLIEPFLSERSRGKMRIGARLEDYVDPRETLRDYGGIAAAASDDASIPFPRLSAA
eukprot:TRINITY_DN9708_c0_g1_i1.p1 TRINITY_DN9708_c0_g1~~TRINITY_DN9708_c0_g1_i1.p1  ORF type:complete len:327 (+),score=96.37 TRINITY_DN9708_c0_g1_i1:75-983(+)